MQTTSHQTNWTIEEPRASFVKSFAVRCAVCTKNFDISRRHLGVLAITGPPKPASQALVDGQISSKVPDISCLEQATQLHSVQHGNRKAGPLVQSDCRRVPGIPTNTQCLIHNRRRNVSKGPGADSCGHMANPEEKSLKFSLQFPLCVLSASIEISIPLLQ